MTVRNGLHGLVAALVLGVAMPAVAEDIGWSDYATGESAEQGAVTLSGGIGLVVLEANELVYDAPGSDTRLSQLIWQNTAPMLTAGLDVALPASWTFSANAQVAMAGDSYMEDYDWIAPYATGTGDDDWSDRSQHDDTVLDWYFNGSLLIGYDIPVSEGMRLNVNGGFKYTDVQWSTYGGSYVYSVGGHRDEVGEFPDGEAGITYRQTFPALIVGLDGEVRDGPWTVAGSAHVGYTIYGIGDDNHWMRDLNFVDNLEPAPLVSVGASVGYEVMDGMKLFVAGTAEQIFTARGDTDIYDIPTGDYLGTEDDGAGGDLFAASVSAGLKGTF